MRRLAATSTAPLRAAALLAAGALVLHELRYLIDPAAGSTAWAGEHSYLSAAAPLVLVAALSLLAVTLLGPALGLRGRRRPSGGDRTGAYALVLLLVHLGQETGEAMAAGTPLDALGVSLLAAAAFAIPLALTLGGLAAFLAGRLERTERRVVAALHRPRATPPAGTAWVRPAPFAVASLDLAPPKGRGPPLMATARA